MASLAIAGPVLNGCASLEAKLRETKDEFGYNTIAHDFLDIEAAAGLNVTSSDYQTLDDIINEAKKRIKVKPEYTKEEAMAVLQTIDKILKDKGFVVLVNDLLSEGLRNKKIDCDNYSVIYLGIADVLDLPLKAASAPAHVFIRWHFDKDRYINWETTIAKEYSDEKYKSWLKITNVSVEKGVFLKSLNRNKFYADIYNAVGGAISGKNKDEAIKYFDKALEINPKHVLAYFNKGRVLYNAKKYKEAIKYYNTVLELHPGYANALNDKKDAERLLKLELLGK